MYTTPKYLGNSIAQGYNLSITNSKSEASLSHQMPRLKQSFLAVLL